VAQPDQERLWCQSCGYARHDPQALQLLAQFIQAGGEEVEFSTDVPPNPTELKFLKDAWAAIQRGDKQTARYICHELVSHNHRLIDAYYMLFLSADTVPEKARHLASILTFSPQHKQAKREMAKLRPIVGENVKPSFFTAHDYREAIHQTIHAKGRLEDCPQCGGRTLYVEGDEVKCLSCNFVPDAKTRSQIINQRPGEQALLITMPEDGGYHSLKDELIRRKYGGDKEWIIAKRVLHCHNCGAQLTLSGGMMTSQCAFCDSQHVLVEDSLQSFQQPDAILPAELDEEQATAHFYKALPKEVQKWVVRHESMGVFLPYWSFKGSVAVLVRSQGTYDLENILIAAAAEPDQKILEDVQPYDFSTLRPYDQRYLASWSAQLYRLDAIQASVTANTYAKYVALMTDMGHDFEDGMLARLDREYQAPHPHDLKLDTALLEMLHFRLLLLPVWMITLHLEGGGHHHAVLNAQTGEIIVTEKVDSKSILYRARRERGVPAPAIAGIHNSSVVVTPSPKRPIKPLRQQEEVPIQQNGGRAIKPLPPR
jgi:ssDNA-binding Zn-finger/Zn-ribbon topoisomerase 1